MAKQTQPLIPNIPFIKYAEALVACKIPNTVILDRIHNLNVQFSKDFKEEYIVEIYNKLYPTNTDYFNKPGSIPELTWLNSLDITKFVAFELKLELPDGTPGIKGALEIMHDADMYKTITAMAMAKINDEDIELIVNGKYNIHYEADDIREFLFYFFNVSEWSLTAKKYYTSLIVNDPKLKKAYELALEGDKDYLIWKLGIAPDKSFDKMLRDMMTDSYYNFKEKSKVDGDTAQKWAGLALRITDRVDKLEKDSDDKKSIFDKIQFVMQGKGELKLNNKYTHINSLKDKEEDRDDFN